MLANGLPDVMQRKPSSVVAGIQSDVRRRTTTKVPLAGVAAETGVIMLIYLDHAWEDQKRKALAEGRTVTRADLTAAIMEGAVERVRPKMMTVIAIMAGLVPILWSHGTGSEVMLRIAVPMIGGMASSTVLTLVVIPAIYALVKGIGLADERRPAREAAKVATAMAP